MPRYPTIKSNVYLLCRSPTPPPPPFLERLHGPLQFTKTKDILREFVNRVNQQPYFTILAPFTAQRRSQDLLL